MLTQEAPEPRKTGRGNKKSVPSVDYVTEVLKKRPVKALGVPKKREK
jgi:hypothetical protein